MMKILRPLLILSLVLAAGGAGYYVGRQNSLQDTTAQRVSEATALKSKNAALITENRTLNAKLKQTQGDAPLPDRAPTIATQNPELGRLKYLADLQNKKLINSTMAFINPRGKITEAFIKLFQLTPTEVSKLQQTIDSSRNQLGQLERQHASVVIDSAGKAVVTVGTFAKEGGAIYDDFNRNIANILGPERNTSYASLGAEQVERALHGFGDAPRTYTLSMNPNPTTTEPWVVSVVEEYKQPEDVSLNATKSASYRSSNRFRAINDMASRYESLIPILPPTFQPKH